MKSKESPTNRSITTDDKESDTVARVKGTFWQGWGARTVNATEIYTYRNFIVKSEIQQQLSPFE